MPHKPVSRRIFMATTTAVPAAAAARQTVVVPPVLLSTTKPRGDLLRIVTTYKFEPAEVQKIKAASTNAKVELTICNSPEEFMKRLRTPVQ